MGVTRDLAGIVERGVGDRMTGLSADVASRSILDWLGCAISGSTSDAANIAARYAGPVSARGASHVIASSLCLETGTAAWLNGIRGHIDDFDDSGSHPASYLTPTVLALGEEVGASGAQVIEAWIIGYEIATRLGEGVRPDRGWHTTSLYGTLGATAAASALLQLTLDQVETAFGIAGSETAGLMRNFGSMAKSLHPANAARAGIEAARLAQLGYESTRGIVEGRYGIVDCFGGPKAHLPSITSRLSGQLLIDVQPPVIKAWPCCTGTHRSLTAVLDIFEEIRLEPGDILRVDHWGSLLPGEGPMQYSAVTTALQGKFSLEYCVAAALIDGRVDHDTFSPERFARGDIQGLMTRVHRHRSPEARLHSQRTADGIDVDVLAIEFRGQPVRKIKLGPRRVLDGDEVEKKFLANAARGRVNAPARQLVETVRDLPNAGSVASLMTMAAAPDEE